MSHEPTATTAAVQEWIDGIYVDDYCPMTYSVEDVYTHVVFGGANAEVELLLPDEALASLAELVSNAVSDMLRARGITTDTHPEDRRRRSTRRTTVSSQGQHDAGGSTHAPTPDPRLRNLEA